MDPLDRARQLKSEADYLLQSLHIPQIYAPYGGVFPTGSFLLDVMAYPDVDLYVPPMSIQQVFEAGGKLAASPLVVEINFKKSDEQNLPGGLYLKPLVSYGNWGRLWKFDIWSIEQAMIDSNLATMHHFQDRMTPSLREQIILYKNTIINEQGRTPMLSGYSINKAFIDEGLTDFASVTGYLKGKGIQV